MLKTEKIVKALEKLEKVQVKPKPVVGNRIKEL
jgi:hypothetical protein